MQREMEASAKASTVATMKLHALRFCESRLQDIFKTLQDTVLGHGYHVAAPNVDEHVEASGSVGKRLAAGRNTEILRLWLCVRVSDCRCQATSESGGIIFRHEQVFTARQFKDDAVASWFSAQLRQAVVVMVHVGRIGKNYGGADEVTQRSVIMASRTLLFASSVTRAESIMHVRLVACLSISVSSSSSFL